jgi:transcriptional regulator with XRE-family HTH domain
MRRSPSPGIERVLFVSGGELAALRRSQGLSRDDLGELTGLHPNTIAKVERGVEDSSILAMSLMQIRLRAIGVVVGGEGFFPCPPSAGTGYPYPKLVLRPASMIGDMGRRTRRRRLELGMSLSGLAEAAGLHRNTVWNFERGLVAPTSSTIYLLYRSLELSWVGGSDEGIVFR